jgi:hypothetical protein
LPLRGRSGVLNGVIGGWSVGGVLTLQSGTPFRLSSGRATVNGGDSGVVLAPGVTPADLQRLIKIGPGPGLNKYFVDPKLIGPDGRANPDYLQVPAEPGQFGQYVFLYGKNLFNVDASLIKSVALSPKTRLTLWIGVFNVFNNEIWSTGLNFLIDANITSQTFGQTDRPANNTNPRSMQVRAGFSF